MSALLALTRAVSASLARCELTHRERETVDVALARAQHRAYEACLAELGCELLRLPEAPELPDAVFVEDTAVVVEEAAVIARPGAESRRPETEAVARALDGHRRLLAIEPPGTLDGGDVLQVDRVLYAGESGRSNRAGIAQLAAHLEPFGYRVTPVAVRGCLHLKSAASRVGERTLLVRRERVDADAFRGLELVEVAAGEPEAANALLVGGAVIYPSAFPATRRRLEERGIELRTLDVSELSKAEGGVTCCSIIFTAGCRHRCRNSRAEP